MKPPVWMKVELLGKSRLIIRIRYWHPLFWFEVVKARLLALWYGWRYGKCDHECTYYYPYGFVPEDGCPVHDPEPDL